MTLINEPSLISNAGEGRTNSIQTIEVPTIIKENSVEVIKVPEIVTKTEVVYVDKIIVQEKIQIVEIPKIIEKIEIKEIETTRLVESGSNTVVTKPGKLISFVLIMQSITIIGLLIKLIF